MGRSKDPRTAEERKAWKKGAITTEEAKAAGSTKKQMNKDRADGEREAGNPLAPPEGKSR